VAIERVVRLRPWRHTGGWNFYLQKEARRMLLKLPWPFQASLLERITALDVLGVINQVLSEMRMKAPSSRARGSLPVSGSTPTKTLP